MNLYETITNRIIAQLEQGKIPWKKEWSATAHGTLFPHNHATGKSYRGINTVSLLCSGYSSSGWMTYKQAQEIGAQVRKGEHGSPVVFWKFDKEKNAETGKDRSSAFMRQYTVFNVDQIDGLPMSLPFEAPSFDPIESAENVTRGYLTGASHPTLAHGGDRAYYQPSSDRVQMPLAGSFHTPAAYYCTLFHEFAHSTGHDSRLSRKFGNHFGNHDYSEEELVAEFTAAFVCAESGISDDSLLTNSTAYIQGWLSKLRGDPKVAIHAAQRAQKAADFILQRRPDQIASEEEVAA